MNFLKNVDFQKNLHILLKNGYLSKNGYLKKPQKPDKSCVSDVNIEFTLLSAVYPHSFSTRRPPLLDPLPFLIVCLRTRGFITIKIPSPENIERTSVLVIINDPNVNLYLIFKLTSPTPNLRIIELEVQRNQTKCVNKTSIKTRRNFKICVAIAHSSGLEVV